MSEHYQPAGIQFEANGREMLFVTQPGYELDGWLCYRHPDGQWVTLRKATPDDRERIAAYCRSREAWYFEQSYFEDSALWEGYARMVEAA